MMTKQDRFLNALKQSGHRITGQRKAVCEYLAQTNDHPTPYQVFMGVTEIHPEISRATVYNTLNTLREVGAIVEIGVGGEHTHYETDTTPHINLICLRCHRVFDYQGDLNIADLKTQIREEVGFEFVTAKVEIMGFCSDCQAHRREEIRQQLR